MEARGGRETRRVDSSSDRRVWTNVKVTPLRKLLRNRVTEQQLAQPEPGSSSRFYQQNVAQRRSKLAGGGTAPEHRRPHENTSENTRAQLSPFCRCLECTHCSIKSHKIRVHARGMMRKMRLRREAALSVPEYKAERHKVNRVPRSATLPRLPPLPHSRTAGVVNKI